MMRRVVLTSAAENDLVELATYIAQDSSSASQRFVDRIRTKCALLAEQPRIGRPYPRRRARLFPVAPYVILYRERPDGIEVLRFFHGRRDPRSL